jgi:hypothetical protein
MVVSAEIKKLIKAIVNFDISTLTAIKHEAELNYIAECLNTDRESVTKFVQENKIGYDGLKHFAAAIGRFPTQEEIKFIQAGVTPWMIDRLMHGKPIS